MKKSVDKHIVSVSKQIRSYFSKNVNADFLIFTESIVSNTISKTLFTFKNKNIIKKILVDLVFTSTIGTKDILIAYALIKNKNTNSIQSSPFDNNYYKHIPKLTFPMMIRNLERKPLYNLDSRHQELLASGSVLLKSGKNAKLNLCKVMKTTIIIQSGDKITLSLRATIDYNKNLKFSSGIIANVGGLVLIM